MDGTQSRDTTPLQIAALHMRGGTSTGIVLWERQCPTAQSLREELIRHLMGVPLQGSTRGNRQITGLGRGAPTSNKVFFADIEEIGGRPRIVSTLAQLAADQSAVDWNVNCGNMSSALQLWAYETNLVETDTIGAVEIDIRNTNTGVVSRSQMVRRSDGSYEATEIPGVMGTYPAVDLFLADPVGAKTGRLLPTGSTIDVVEGVRLSCVDVAVPMVIVPAAELGKTAHEPMAELEADAAFMERLRSIWVAAGLRMGLRDRSGSLMTAEALARSETIPKICIVGEARNGGNIATRYFTPQAGHASLAVSGGCCLAAASLTPGTVAHEIATGVPDLDGASEILVGLENPAGVLDCTIAVGGSTGERRIVGAAYRRSAQILMRGTVPIYGCSPELARAMADLG